MRKLTISECASKAWDLTTGNLILVLFTFVMIAGTLLAGELFPADIDVYSIKPGMQPYDVFKDSMGAVLPGTLLSIVVGCALTAGYTKMCLNTYNGIKPELSAYKMPVGRYLMAVGVMFITGLIIYVGIIFLVIPGLYLACRLLFTSLIVIDDPKCEFGEAFSRSWQMTKGHAWKLFWMGVVGTIFGCIGVLCLGIGVLFAIPLVYMMQVVAYNILKGE